MAKLGEVCKVSSSTKNIERQGAWLLNLDMVEQQTGRVIEYKYVGEDDLNGSIIQFDTENVLYSKLRPNLNKVVLPQKDGFSTSELLPLRPDARVLNRDYLAVFLRSDSFVTWAVSKTAGAKMPRLGTKDLMSAEIPVPTIEQQKKIAEKFKKLEQLISLRNQQLAKLDELVKARFVEMFGDPKANCQKKKLSQIGNISTGTTPSMKELSYYERDDIPFIKPSDLNENGVAVIDKAEMFISEKARSVARIIPPDAVLVTCIGTIGKIGIAKTESSCNQQINYIVPKDNINPIYLAYCLLLLKDILVSMANAPVVPIINKTQFSEFSIPISELNQQNQFASFVERVDQQKQTIQQSLEKLELLKKALMQEYFG